MITAADTTAEHAAACQALWDRSGGFSNDGPFTPFTFHDDGAPSKSTISFPGGIGGVNWGGTAADPRTGYLYVNSHDTSLVGWVEKKNHGVTYSFDAVGSRQPYDRASVDGVGPFHTFSASIGKDGAGREIIAPCQRPPWSRLIAVDANTGEIASGDDARDQREPTGGKTARRWQRQRGSDGHRGRTCVRRRD